MARTKCGIYSITCLDSRKMYIGRSKDIGKRWQRHRSDLRYGIGVNPHIQNAWRLYGEKSFVFSVIEECAPEQLKERELYWIRHYNTTDNTLGYNILEEYINTQPIENKNKRKEVLSEQVVCIDTTTWKIAVLDSFREVAEVLNTTINCIQECLASWRGTEAKAKRWSTKGFITVYLSDYNENKDYKQEYENRIKEGIETRASKIRKEKLIKAERGPREGTRIRAISIETGEVREYPNKGEMCRALDLLKSKVFKCLSPNNGTTQHRGYRFEVQKDLEPTN